MIPGKYDIDIWRGGTWSIGLNATNVDFASYDSIRMQVKPPWIKSTSTKPALLELTLDNGRVTIEDSDLTLRLTVSADDTSKLVFDEGVYDLELVKDINLSADPPIPVQIVDKLLYGSVQVHGEVTT